MTVSIVQQKTNPTTADTLFPTTTAPSVVLATAPTDTTHWVVVLLDLVASTTITAINGYSKAGAEYNGAEGTIACLYRKVQAGDTSTVAPCTLGVTSQGDMTAYEVLGLDQITPLDQQIAGARRSTNGTTLSLAASAGLATASSLVVAGCRTSGSDGGSLSWPSGGLSTDFNGFGGGSGHVITTASTPVTVGVGWSSSTTAILDAWIFKAASSGGRPKINVASVWTQKPAKIWNGSTWVEKPVKKWNGSSWVPLT